MLNSCTKRDYLPCAMLSSDYTAGGYKVKTPIAGYVPVVDH